MLDLLPDSHIDLADTSGWAVQMQQQQGQVKSFIVEMLKCTVKVLKSSNVQMPKCSSSKQEGKVKSSNDQIQEKQGHVN